MYLPITVGRFIMRGLNSQRRGSCRFPFILSAVMSLNSTALRAPCFDDGGHGPMDVVHAVVKMPYKGMSYIKHKQGGKKLVSILIAICYAWIIFKDRHVNLAALPAIMQKTPCNLWWDRDVVNTHTHSQVQTWPLHVHLLSPYAFNKPGHHVRCRFQRK